MNDTGSHLDRAATRSGKAVKLQNKSYASLTVLKYNATTVGIVDTVLHFYLDIAGVSNAGPSGRAV